MILWYLCVSLCWRHFLFFVLSLLSGVYVHLCMYSLFLSTCPALSLEELQENASNQSATMPAIHRRREQVSHTHHTPHHAHSQLRVRNTAASVVFLARRLKINTMIINTWIDMTLGNITVALILEWMHKSWRNYLKKCHLRNKFEQYIHNYINV